MTQLRELMHAGLTTRLADAPAALVWLDQKVETARTQGPDVGFLAAFAGTQRRVGQGPGDASADLQARFTRATATIDGVWPRHAGVAELARMLLLLAADEFFQTTATPLARRVAFVDDLYHKGAMTEQVAVVRTLAYLDQAAAYLELAVEVCRSNAVPVFAAIACDNPYPATHFSQPQFNQLVLKTMFLDLRCTQLVGLARRCNPELGRMLDDFARERQAASRPLPPDLPAIAAICRHLQSGKPSCP